MRKEGTETGGQETGKEENGIVEEWMNGRKLN